MPTSTTTTPATPGSRRAELRQRRQRLLEEGAVLLTDPGRRTLTGRADLLRHVVLPELRAALAERERDRRVDADYHRAVDELMTLEGLLTSAGSTGTRAVDGRVGLGDGVELLLPGGGREQVLVVHAVEAPLDDRRTSQHSPLARALLGARVGDDVRVDAPSGTYRVRVLSIARE